MRVWLTRTEPGATRQAEVLADHGFAIFKAPVLRIEQLRSSPPDGCFDLAVFVSEHAVAGAFANGWRGGPTLAIGNAAHAALERGGRPSRWPAQGSSSAVIDTLQGSFPKRTLVVKGEGGTDTLQRWLGSRQGIVVDWSVYRRVRNEPAIAAETIDAIVAASGEGLRVIGQLWFAQGRDPKGAAAGTVGARLSHCRGAGVRQRDHHARSRLHGGRGRPGQAPQRRGNMTDPEDSAAKQPKASDPPSADTVATPTSSRREVEPKAVDKPGDSPRPPVHRQAVADQPPKPGRAVAVLALLIALAAAGLAGYLFWLDWSDDPHAHAQTLVRTEVSAVRGEANRRQEEMQQALAALADELQTVRGELAEQQAALADTRRALAEARATRPAEAPPSSHEWKLAEVEYLLSVANHRLHLQRDARGADTLLARADDLLADLDDFAFHDVRALVSAERLSLRTFEDVDIQGLFLRLEATKGLLQDLPLRLPEYVAGDPQEPDAADGDVSILASLLSRLEGLVRFRRHEGEAVRPLLAPAQAEYLEQHMVLALERAQLALLRHDQRIYTNSLQSARQWLHRFVNPERAVVVEAKRELDALLAVDLAEELPDISGSLALLRGLREAPPAEAEPQ